ncbi:MAG: molecular chaperone HtpG, partial [Candidatus Shikimatogenerans sp. JK-2022]|nr:molecular chaperone HtpG [Candidatus Shikimatogenerans bostrichidophilus]
FYHYLYDKDYNDPILWIHLKTDYPFDLKGILYLPIVNKYIDIKENNIHIYQKHIFVTDNIKGLLPDILVLFKGIIESSDIPLNVSRSNIQNNKNILKISNYIIRKVIDKIITEIKYNRENIIKKWKYIEPLVIYGIISNDKFLNNYNNLILFNTIDNKFFTIDELIKRIKKRNKQIDKNNKIVIIYSKDYNLQYNYIKEAKKNGYKDIILNTNPMFLHMIQKLEMKNNKLLFISVDSDFTDIFIKDDNYIDKKKEEKLIKLIKDNIIIDKKFNIKIKKLSSNILPINITKSEFLNRYKEINKLNYNKDNNNINEEYNLIININNKKIKKILNIIDNKKKNNMLKFLLNFYFILNNLLKGVKLNKFINKIINYII